MKLQGNTPLETIKRIALFIITIVVTFFVIFFLWIPLLIIVCIFLLTAFILRKKMKVQSFGSFGKKKNVYATWTSSDTQKSTNQSEYKNNDCVDADYISLDDKEERKK
jgi:hypothetical protein